jgi:hypothetical protein
VGVGSHAVGLAGVGLMVGLVRLRNVLVVAALVLGGLGVKRFIQEPQCEATPGHYYQWTGCHAEVRP